VKARSQAANQLQALLLVTAPEDLRHRLRQLPTKDLVATPVPVSASAVIPTRFARQRQVRAPFGGSPLRGSLERDRRALDAQLDQLVAQLAPELVSLRGIATDHAATLLIVAGDNPQRLRSEASFASLCGVSPVQASSGKVVRHRLNLM
jgi:transposase